MSFRINTNISAMNSLRNLKQTGMEVSKSTNRLSTGLRINSASDDPSGLIASESYRAQLGSMDAALKNNQDAINYAKTAEGGLDETSRLLREARSLAVANGSSALDSTQKQANQTQLNNILQSIDRVSNNTQYGSIKLLNGSAGTTTAVANKTAIDSASFTGSFGGEAVTASGGVNVQVTTAASQATFTDNIPFSSATDLVGAGSFTINGKTFSSDAATTIAQAVQMVNEASGETGVTATFDDPSNTVQLKSAGYGSDQKINYTQTGAGMFGPGLVWSGVASGADAVASVTVGSSTVTFDKGKGLNLKDSEGNSIKLTEGGNATSTYTSAIQLTAGSTKFQIGANAGQTTTLSIGNFSSSTLGLSGLDITGSDMASALDKIDSAIGNVSESRGRIGSFVRNTIESNVRSLNVAKENLAATESSVREVDVAEEMTNFTKQQILQQSGISMLAQANSAPQAVLSLIR